MHRYFLRVNRSILAHYEGEGGGVTAVFFIYMRGVFIGNGRTAIAKIPAKVAALGKVGVLAEVGKLNDAAKVLVCKGGLRVVGQANTCCAGKG